MSQIYGRTAGMDRLSISPVLKPSWQTWLLVLRMQDALRVELRLFLLLLASPWLFQVAFSGEPCIYSLARTEK